MNAPIPTASELYDRHAPILYGTVLRLADGACAEEAFQDACIELWDTAAKRSQPCSITRMIQVSVSKAREHCMKGGTTPEFERRLSELVSELRERVEAKEGSLVDPRQNTRRRNEEVNPHALIGNEYP